MFSSKDDALSKQDLFRKMDILKLSWGSMVVKETQVGGYHASDHPHSNGSPEQGLPKAIEACLSRREFTTGSAL